MENEILMDDTPQNDQKNYESWELSGEDNPAENTMTMEKNKTGKKSEKITASPASKGNNKNSAAKAASQAQSAVGNTNPGIRTGLSDGLNNTGTNVAYTERES